MPHNNVLIIKTTSPNTNFIAQEAISTQLTNIIYISICSTCVYC